MRIICFLLSLLLLAQSSSAQEESPYAFHWKRDLVYSSGAGLLFLGGIFAEYQTRPLTESQVLSLDPYKVPGFDRTAIGNWNPKAATASDAFMYGMISLPAFLMIHPKARKDFLVIGFMYAEVAMITIGITELSKGLALRARPYAYNDQVDMETRTSRDARHSFFSGHTSTTAALCFATAKIFSDYSDNRTHEALVWTAAVLVPAATGFLRFEAGKHFPSDIITGYVVGGAIGYLVPFLHKRKPLVKGMSLFPYFNGSNGTGIYLSYRL